MGPVAEEDSRGQPCVVRCRAEMKIISIITDPRIIDRILRHRQSERCKAQDPFESRAPPQPAASVSHQRYCL
jgi:hypothetical protein